MESDYTKKAEIQVLSMTPESLAKILGIPVDVVRLRLDKFYAAYPELKKYVRKR